jgi:formyl-CoA transferase
MLLELPHPAAGSVPLVASPMRFAQSPPGAGTAPPLLGQHNLEILRELELGDGEIERLRTEGTI